MKLNISKTINYRSFGFIPSGKFSVDLYGKLLGHPNILKRLQAKDIINALSIAPADIVLDFGCGAGYMTVEIAKAARMTYGIDVNPYISTIPVPALLKDKLHYTMVDGQHLPFEDSYFDKILASEILPMIKDPAVFIKEIYRVMKPGGRLVISNGAGHPSIKRAYENNSILLKLIEWFYNKRVPESYEEYCRILQSSFGTKRDSFIQQAEIHDVLESVGFTVEETIYSPSYIAGAYFSWSQFLLYMNTGRTLAQHKFALKYLFWSLVGIFQMKGYPGGIICVAQLKDKL